MSELIPSDPTQRFSARALHYARSRPGYPPAILQFLKEQFGLNASWTIADLGSGTGKLSELFLAAGCWVYGVEPNRDMRLMAEKLLNAQPQFISIDAQAEATTLEPASVDLLVAGQAYHWFDVPRARAEALRILRPGGVAALIWNDRRSEAPFTRAYEAFLTSQFPNYQLTKHRRHERASFEPFFGHADFISAAFDNHLRLDLTALIGLINSASYAPLGWESSPPILSRLAALFDQYQVDGRIVLDYDTRIYAGPLAESA